MVSRDHAQPITAVTSGQSPLSSVMDEGAKLESVLWRLDRFAGGEHAKTVYALPPSGSYAPLRQDIEALVAAWRGQSLAGKARAEALENALGGMTAAIRAMGSMPHVALTGRQWQHLIDPLHAADAALTDPE